MTQWWAADVTEANDAVELGFFNRATVYRLRTTLAQPPGRIEWLCESGKEWSGTHLLFALEAAGNETARAFHPCRVGIRDRLFRLLHHHLGRTHVPSESRRRRKTTQPLVSARQPRPTSAGLRRNDTRRLAD